MGKYDGMTLNERLFDAGLYYEFEEAMKEGNLEKMTIILKKVDIMDAEEIAHLNYERYKKSQDKK